MLGIANLKLATLAVAELGVVMAGAVANGPNVVKDAMYIPQLMKAMKDFGKVQYADLIPEVEDLDETERQDLANSFQASFKIDSQTVEEIVDEGFTILTWGLEAVQAIESIIGVVKPAA